MSLSQKKISIILAIIGAIVWGVVGIFGYNPVAFIMSGSMTVLAVEAKKDCPDGSYISSGKPTRSIHTHVENGRRILIVVGENHATAHGEDNMELHYENLIQYAERIAGLNKLLAKWSAQDHDTPDQIPYIGRLSDNLNIYVAAAFKSGRGQMALWRGI